MWTQKSDGIVQMSGDSETDRIEEARAKKKRQRSGHQQPWSHPLLLFLALASRKLPFSLKNAKCTAFHRPHKGPPSSQLHKHNQTRHNYVIRMAGADRDPLTVCWCFKFVLSEFGLIRGGSRMCVWGGEGGLQLWHLRAYFHDRDYWVDRMTFSLLFRRDQAIYCAW